MKSQISASRKDAPATPPTTPPAIAPALTDEDEFAGGVLVGVIVDLDDGKFRDVVEVDIAGVDIVEVGVATISSHVSQQIRTHEEHTPHTGDR
jgi:hypothetical protein